VARELSCPENLLALLTGFFEQEPSTVTLTFFCQMKVANTPAVAPGESTVTIQGVAYKLRFSLNVLRDFSTLTGRGPSELGPMLTDNYAEALTALMACAVRRFVPSTVFPKGFSQDDAADLIDALPADEAKALAEAITEAIVSPNPLMAALTATVAAKNRARTLSATSESGTNTSTSDSASSL
jgi:hypothetical protein